MSSLSVTTSSLLFACAERSALSAIGQRGLGNGTPLHSRFEDAQQRCPDCILVLDAYSERGVAGDPATILNLDPYLVPRSVTAAGGFITRGIAPEIEILLIFRRGVWDVPKGKLDPGESIEECATREVREEVGIGAVTITSPLGQTIHGYRDGEAYAVKTTHWFAMTTDAVRFKPQRKEKIEKVVWMPLPDARRRLGFETLRRHLGSVEDALTSAATRERQ